MKNPAHDLCLQRVSAPQLGSALTNPHNLFDDHRGGLTLVQPINKLLAVSTDSGFCGSVKKLELNYQQKKEEGEPNPCAQQAGSGHSESIKNR